VTKQGLEWAQLHIMNTDHLLQFASHGQPDRHMTFISSLYMCSAPVNDYFVAILKTLKMYMHFNIVSEK
jgi:hypothetical protein